MLQDCNFQTLKYFGHSQNYKNKILYYLFFYMEINHANENFWNSVYIYLC